MKSIYRLLSGWLLAGFGVAGLGTGFLIYSAVRHGLEGRFDAELRAMSSEVRFLLPEGRQLRQAQPPAYWFDFYRPDSGLYFEAWDEYGVFSDRSASLGARELPRPASFAAEPRFWNATLAAGERVRLVAQQYRQAVPGSSGAEMFPINVIVARDRRPLDVALRRLLAATVSGGVLLVPVFLAIVWLAVRRGLRPLRDFADRTAGFGMDSLHERFATSGLPAELVPVSRRLNELLARLEAGIERERRLNQDLAHELKTPVAELKTIAEVALAWPAADAAQSFQAVLAAANQMQTMIGNMLMLARWERQTERPAMEAIAVDRLLEEGWLACAAAAQAKRLRVRTAIPTGATVQTNPELLRIVVGNLFSNAVEYCPPGGELSVDVQTDGAQFQLAVANTVENLDAEAAAHLFERFWRRDPARHGNGHAGLGLPLAKTCAAVLGLSLAAVLDETNKQITFRLFQPPSP